MTRRYKSFKSEVAKRPPSSGTNGRKSGGNTGNTSIGDYYTLDGFASFDPVKNKVDTKIAESWINNYVTKKRLVIKKTLDKNDVTNYMSVSTPLNEDSLFDTRCIHYESKEIAGLKDEINYQTGPPNSITITGIRTFFSAFTASGNDEGKCKGRMFIQFEFLRKDSNGKDVVFYLEDTDDFCSRGWPGNRFDNGQMCPPTCVPPPPPVKP